MMESQINISTTSRETVEVHLPDGRILTGKRGSCVGEFLRVLPEWGQPPIMGAVVNNELRELTYPIDFESRVRPVTMADDDGARIYRRSLTFLMQLAFEDLFPQADLAVDHSVTSGGYYCEPIGRGSLSNDELAMLDAHMKELVAQDLPFERQVVPIEEAAAYFKNKNQTEKVSLLKYRQKSHLVLYKLRERRDYHHGYMVPSTGYLRWFGFTLMGEGFVLRFTRRNTPTELSPLPDYSKLVKTFRQYGSWLNRLNIESVGTLNDAIAAGRAREIILVSEALHEQKIADIARQIVSLRDRVRIVLVSGPSSSGKTTFSKRLTVQLLAQGISPYPLELDNYFVDRELTPRDRNGDYDYESLGALNTALLAENLRGLVAGQEVQLPHYNFKTGKSEVGDVVHLEPGQIVILEGIHGLNPKLLPDFPSEQTYRVYVSCLTQLNLDRHNRISTTDTRLLRRCVRDARERGYSASDTIRRWESVRRGEKVHIFPYQENADEMFNSALVYDLPALRKEAEPLLRQVPHGTPEFIEAKRLLAFLEWFLPLEVDLIPDNSIIREFLGGSILKDFKIWRTQ